LASGSCEKNAGITKNFGIKKNYQHLFATLGQEMGRPNFLTNGLVMSLLLLAYHY
jgi:hypothetical protein